MKSIPAQSSASASRSTGQRIFAVIRIAIGFIFLWAFLDKALGLGFDTASDQAWIDGASPTEGFLTYGTKGPFQQQYQAIAGNVLTDWLYMIGMLLIGISLILGIAQRLACSAGIAMMLLIYLAAFPPAHNPLIDEHIIYILALLGIMFSKAGDVLGFGKKWKQAAIVQKWSVLQ